MSPRRRLRPSRDTRAALLLAAALACVAFVWGANSSGLISSNDGSHLALARALVLRGETSLESERALTLEVDLAEREGRAYSDRPPGTAFAALPAVKIGAALDPPMRRRAVRQARAREPVKPLPAAKPYIMTYAARAGPGAPALVDLIGTSVAISIHAAIVGLLGLLLVEAGCRRLGATLSARVFALLGLGLASAWGPYSTALFSHVSAGTAVAAMVLAILIERDEPRARPTPALAVGLAGAWAISCDYLLVLVVVPAVALTLPWRRWPWVLLGSAPVAIATLAYHGAAFGGLFAIGYDHQVNFAFARARASTFSGDPLAGLWTLWGAGRGAGLLVQSPISLVGLAALVGLSLRRQPQAPATAPPVLTTDSRRTLGLILAATVLWVIALAFHRTPWGGGTGDHRYLIPILPLVGLGLALAWDRGAAAVRGGLVLVATASVVMVWRPFLAWHESPPLDRPLLGLGLAIVAFALSALWLKNLRPVGLRGSQADDDEPARTWRE